MSEATYDNWRNKYGGPMRSETKRLKQLDEESSTEAACRRSQPGQGDAAGRDPPENINLAGSVRWSTMRESSGRSVFGELGRGVPVERSSFLYCSRRAGQTPLSKRIKEIAETRVRYDYPRIHVLLRREGGL
jgi:hypothetical protein